MACVTCLAVLGCGDASDRPPAGPDADLLPEAGHPVAPQERASALCAAVSSFVAERNLAGAVAATRFPNGATHACATGRASVAEGTPLQSGDRFRIGSISKTFVATTVLLLAEDGLVSLSDTLSRWVPGFANDPTLAQMLNHTSGLGEYLFDDALRAAWDQPHELADLIAVARSKSTTGPPGQGFEYSNTNYLLMGAIIEAAAKKPWSQVVRERILDRLSLRDTFVYGFEAASLPFVSGHAWDGTRHTDVTLSLHPTIAAAAGCFVSSAPDLVRWASALYGGEVLQPSSLRAMTHDYRTPHVHANGVYEGAFVGLANFVETDDLGETWGHAGGLPGFMGNMRYIVRDGRVLVVLLNQNESHVETALTNAAWIALLL